MYTGIYFLHISTHDLLLMSSIALFYPIVGTKKNICKKSLYMKIYYLVYIPIPIWL